MLCTTVTFKVLDKSSAPEWWSKFVTRDRNVSKSDGEMDEWENCIIEYAGPQYSYKLFDILYLMDHVGLFKTKMCTHNN
jgi:hypothetical protein